MSATATATALPTATWGIDPIHSTIGFAVKHLGVSTYRGSFPGAAGSVVTENGAIAAVSGTVEVAGLSTADANLTGHLLAPDFFDAATYPQASFASTRVEQGEDGSLRIEGDITLRGVTKPVVLTGELEGVGGDPYGNTRLGLTVKGVINRTDFGVSWNSVLANGALAVAEKVTVEVHAEAIAQGLEN